MTWKPRSANSSHSSRSQWISCVPSPITSSSAGFEGSPIVSYAISIPLAVARSSAIGRTTLAPERPDRRGTLDKRGGIHLCGGAWQGLSQRSQWPRSRHRQASAPALVARLLDRTGTRRAGPGAPSLGVLTLRGTSRAIARLRRDPAVERVSREWVRKLRRVPNDPALGTAEDEFNVVAGTPIQWALARLGFPTAWDVTTGAEARVAVLDTGVDASHPELAGKILTAESIDGSDPGEDRNGHGTHVAGLACASTDDGVGVAGAGWGCGLHIVKLGTDLTGGVPDEDIVRGLALAIAHSPHAINMSFRGGPDSAALGAAIQAAYERGIVLVAAAANANDADRQGAPASMLQPGDAANLDAGRGLVVTAADFEDTPGGTGRGPGISLAAYGFYDERHGPPGLISTYPGAFTLREVPACARLALPICSRRDIGGSNAYPYLHGTSMATPHVTALAALIGALNPHLTAAEKIRYVKETARRAGGWTPDLDWGILDRSEEHTSEL